MNDFLRGVVLHVLLIFVSALVLGCGIGVITTASHYSIPHPLEIPRGAIAVVAVISLVATASLAFMFWVDDLGALLKSIACTLFDLEEREDTYRCSICRQSTIKKKYRELSSKRRYRFQPEKKAPKSQASSESTSVDDLILPPPPKPRRSARSAPDKSQQKDPSTVTSTDSSTEEPKDDKAKLRLDRS